MLCSPRLVHLALLFVLLANSCVLSPAPSPLANGAPVADAAHEINLQLLGHISGAATDMALTDHYALLGFSYEVVVLDLADLTQPQWVTSLPLPTTAIAVAEPYAYVAGRNGFAVVDLHEPTTPVVISTLALPETAAVVAVTANVAYVAVFGDLYAIDLTNPQQPTVLSVTRLARRISGMAALAQELYAVTDEGFLRLDVSNPVQPIVLETLLEAHLSYGPVIANGALYFGNKQRLWVKAPGTAVAPRAIVLDLAVDAILDVAVVDNVAYLASSFQGLRVWDLDAPATAVEIGAYPLSGLTKVVIAQAGYVYTLDCDEGLRIFDAADPSRLLAIGTFTPLGISYALAVNDAFAYIAAGFNGGLHQLVFTNPAQVHTIDTHLTQIEVNDLAIADDYLYLVGESSVGVIDLTTPSAPQFVALYPLMSAWGIAAAGALLYVSDYSGNVWLLDRTDPVRLAPTAYYPDLGYVSGMAVDGQMAYIPHRTDGMRLLAIDQQGELTLVGRYASTLIHKIVVAHGYAYLALGTQGIAVVDVTDPTASHLVSRHDTPGAARDLSVQWPYLLVADSIGGLRVLDLTTVTQLVEVASYVSCDGASQVASANGLFYVTQPLGGLWLFTLTPPQVKDLSVTHD